MTASPQPETRVRISPKFILWWIGAVLAVLTLYKIHHIILMLVLSGLVATALYPPVAWLKARKFPERVSVLLFYLCFILLAIGFTGLLGGILYEQGIQFVSNLPRYLNSATQFLNQYPFFSDESGFLATLQSNIPALLSQVAQMIFSSLNSLKVVFSSVFGIITILVFTFFLLGDTQYFEGVFLDLFPENRRKRFQEMTHEVIHDVGTYVRGQLIVMGAMGLVTFAGLMIVGVPYAFVLGVIVFLLDIIPLVGPLIAASFGILIALGTDPTMAIWAALVYLVAQQLENYVFIPMILGRSVGLHPFWILFSIMIGGTLFGIVGVLLAVPTALTFRILYREFRKPS